MEKSANSTSQISSQSNVKLSARGGSKIGKQIGAQINSNQSSHEKQKTLQKFSQNDNKQEIQAQMDMNNMQNLSQDNIKDEKMNQSEISGIINLDQQQYQNQDGVTNAQMFDQNHIGSQQNDKSYKNSGFNDLEDIQPVEGKQISHRQTKSQLQHSSSKNRISGNITTAIVTGKNQNDDVYPINNQNNLRLSEQDQHIIHSASAGKNISYQYPGAHQIQTPQFYDTDMQNNLQSAQMSASKKQPAHKDRSENESLSSMTPPRLHFLPSQHTDLDSLPQTIPNSQQQMYPPEISQQQQQQQRQQKQAYQIMKQQQLPNHQEQYPEQQTIHLKQQSEPSDDSQQNIQISALQKSPVDLQNQLNKLIEEIEVYMPKSFDYLKALDLQNDLKRSINMKGPLVLNESLNSRITQFIREQEGKIQRAKQSLNVSQNSAILRYQQQQLINNVINQQQNQTQSQNSDNQELQNLQQLTYQGPSALSSRRSKQQSMAMAYLSEDQQVEYQSLIQNYESSLNQIMAKDVMKFKSLQGRGYELQIGIALLYYLVSQEPTIMLSNDKKYIVNQSWEEVKKQFSNGGKVIFAFKKIKDYIENDLITNVHFAQIISLSENLQASPGSGQVQDQTLQIFQSYLLNAIALTKYLKLVKGHSEDQFKPLPSQRKLQNFKSPERQKTIDNINGASQSQGRNLKRLQSPNGGNFNPGQSQQSLSQNRKSTQSNLSQTQKDFKSDLNTQIYHQETQNLLESAEKKQQLKMQKMSLTQVQLTLNKLKFEMEREEKVAMKVVEKQEEISEIQFQKEQQLMFAQLQEEKKKKEKEDFLIRQQEWIDEQKSVKTFKKQEEQRLLLADTYDFEREQQFKREIEQKRREEELEQIRLNQVKKMEKDEYEKEQYRLEKLREQKEREVERKLQLRSEMEDLRTKEKKLQDEIEYLKQMRAMPVKVPTASGAVSLNGSVMFQGGSAGTSQVLRKQ
eukprot:403338878